MMYYFITHLFVTETVEKSSEEALKRSEERRRNRPEGEVGYSGLRYQSYITSTI